MDITGYFYSASCVIAVDGSDTLAQVKEKLVVKFRVLLARLAELRVPRDPHVGVRMRGGGDIGNDDLRICDTVMDEGCAVELYYIQPRCSIGDLLRVRRRARPVKRREVGIVKSATTQSNGIQLKVVCVDGELRASSWSLVENYDEKESASKVCYCTTPTARCIPFNTPYLTSTVHHRPYARYRHRAADGCVHEINLSKEE